MELRSICLHDANIVALLHVSIILYVGNDSIWNGLRSSTVAGILLVDREFDT